MRTVLIGGGVMGEAILGSALQQGALTADQVVVVEKVDERRDALAQAYGVEVAADATAAMNGADVVIVAVKPQDAGKLAGTVRDEALIISVMAGVQIETLAAQFEHRRIVRVMPNTPVTVQQGMCAWTATTDVDGAQREFVRMLLRSMGRELYLDAEAKLDMATAVSGSGPAYVFLFIESMIEAGVSVGLARPEAELLVSQTFLGAATYAIESGEPAATLRGRVTSPAGTTAAGLNALERRAVRAAVTDAVESAFRRAQELGGAR